MDYSEATPLAIDESSDTCVRRRGNSGGSSHSARGAQSRRDRIRPYRRTVVRLLRDNQIAPTVAELNMDSVLGLQKEGVDAVYGDATQTETLTAAGVASAGSLILTSAGMAHSTEVIRAARRLNPKVRVLARAAYLRDLAPLKKAGADTAYSGESEVALTFIEDILDTLGATPEQNRQGTRARTWGVVWWSLKADAVPCFHARGEILFSNWIWPA